MRSRSRTRAALAAAAFLALTAAACGGRSTAPAAAATATEPGAAREPAVPDAAGLVGQYQCRFARGERDHPPELCAIRRAEDGTLRLEQPGGALRLSGTVTAGEPGFRFTGEVVCAQAPCPAPGTRDIPFFAQRPGAYSAVLPLASGDLLNIDLSRSE
jgi:hypothetical protein